MSGSVVRELVTLWGFEVDQGPLKELDVGLNTIKSTLASIGIAVAATAAGIGYLLNEAGEDEQTTIAFETMLGSAEEAHKRLAELKDFAAKTPFELTGLKESAKKLLAFNFSGQELIPTLKALGDISSGVGRDKLPQLILAFGQVKAATRLTGMELRQFTEAGVPLLGELSKTMGKSEAEIQQMIHDKKIRFEDVQKALFALTTGGGRFANLMDKQSKSFLGMISNMKDQLNIMAIDIGNSILPLAKELSTAFLDWVDANKELIKTNILDFVSTLSDFLFGLIAVVKAFFGILSGIVHIFGDWNDAIRLTTKLFTAFMGLGLLYGIGLIAKGIYGLATAWYTMGPAAMWAQVKMMLIPLAIGAVIAAIALIAEDIYAFSQGRDSVFGRMLNGIVSVFGENEKKFSGLGDFMRGIITFLLTPIRALIAGFRNIGTAIDMVRGKKGVLEGLKEMGQRSMDVYDISKSSGSLKSALGFADSVQAANSQVANSNTPMVGLGKPLPAGTNVNAQNEITLNVTGMEPQAAQDLVLGSLNETLGGMRREAVRDGGSQIER